MITDHGVRTLFCEANRRGYFHEQAGKYNAALKEYTNALNIAKSFEDEDEINNSLDRINRVKNKMKENELIK